MCRFRLCGKINISTPDEIFNYTTSLNTSFEPSICSEVMLSLAFTNLEFVLVRWKIVERDTTNSEDSKYENNLIFKTRVQKLQTDQDEISS